MQQEVIQKLTDYFASRDEVVLAYLFGSQVKGTASPVRSDYDVAVYFKPKTGVFEYEESEYSVTDYSYDTESIIQADLEKITSKDVDLVVLNRAPAYLVASVLKTGVTLKEADRVIFLELWTRSLSDAEDYYVLFKEYNEIMARSKSVSDQDKAQLRKIIAFLTTELEEFKEYSKIDQIMYMHDARSRKVLERNIENMANAALDIAKILLASQKKHLPDKYADMMIALWGLGGFDEQIARYLAEGARLRNFLAHEYLDYRYKKIKKFCDDAENGFTYLIEFAEKILKAE